jgi:serine/threonine-protein kinase
MKEILLITPFILIILAAFYVGNRIYQNNFAPQEVEVPDIEGISQEDANRLLRENDLFLEVIGSKNDNDIEEGHIISQDPESGMMVKPYTTVRVVVSLGPELIEVPNVVGKPKRDAEIELEDEGLIIGEPEYEYSEYPSGIVIEQSISPMTQVLKGAEIVLTISKGPEENIVEVGNYIGQQLEVATQLIQGDRLKLGQTREEYNEEYSKGTVIKQYPEPGSTVSEYREIDLVISAGPIPTYPKELKIDLTGIKDRDTVNIIVEKTQDGKKTEEYNRFHAVAEKEVVIRLEGKGSAKYDIYIDGVLYHTEVIDFTQKQKEEDE